MKKYLVADLVKDLREDQINRAMEQFDLNRANAEIFVDDFPNESTWADVEEVAESLGVDITDVEDDDIENYMSLGRANKGELESSIGPIQWIYDNTLKAYLVLAYLTFELGKEPKEVMYKLNPDQFRNWFNSKSIGEYWNDNIRANTEIEDDEWACGCNPNPCDPQKVDRFNTRFVSIS